MTRAKANALLITRNFPPLTGGMERLTFHTYESLREQYHCAVVGPSGCNAYIQPETPVAECHLKPLPRFLAEAWIKSHMMGRKYRPQLVLAASGLTAPVAVSIAKRFGCAAIIVVHGLDLVARQPVYQKLFVPAIGRANLVLVNSNNTAKLAQAAGVTAEKIRILHPGAKIPERVTESGFRQANGLLGRHVLLSVGRLVPRKGLVEFIDLALPELVARDPAIMLLIAGGEAQDALKHETDMRSRIEYTAENRGLTNHVRLLGTIEDDAKLDALYSAADVLVMPLVEYPGDVEGFGMVAVEAAAHGLPTVGFRLGGLPDAVANGRSGLLVPPHDYAALIDATLKLLNQSVSPAITEQTCRLHASQYSWDCYRARLRDLCSAIPSTKQA